MALTPQVSIGQGHGQQGAIEARSCAPLTPQVRIVRISAPCRQFRARYEPPRSGTADLPGQAGGPPGASRVARSERDGPDPRRGDPRRDGRARPVAAPGGLAGRPPCRACGRTWNGPEEPHGCVSVNLAISTASGRFGPSGHTRTIGLRQGAGQGSLSTRSGPVRPLVHHSSTGRCSGRARQKSVGRRSCARREPSGLGRARVGAGRPGLASSGDSDGGTGPPPPFLSRDATNDGGRGPDRGFDGSAPSLLPLDAKGGGGRRRPTRSTGAEARLRGRDTPLPRVSRG